MSVEDKRLLREVTRELNRRRSLDYSDTKVSVSRAVAYISGVIRPALGEFVDPKIEMKAIEDSVRRVNGIKDMAIDARFEISTKDFRKA